MFETHGSKDEKEGEEEPFDIDPGNEDPGSQLDRDATVPLLDPDALSTPAGAPLK